MWKKLRVSYVLNKNVEDGTKKFPTLGHCFGVNSIIFSKETNEENSLGTLFSGGRDSTIRKWRISENKGRELLHLNHKKEKQRQLKKRF